MRIFFLKSHPIISIIPWRKQKIELKKIFLIFSQYWHLHGSCFRKNEGYLKPGFMPAKLVVDSDRAAGNQIDVVNCIAAIFLLYLFPTAFAILARNEKKPTCREESFS
jgi:hypothetical protein